MSSVQNLLIDSGLRCLNCRYNLTGLDGSVCPECGTKFDREALLLDSEYRRVGTAVHRARGFLKAPATLLTALTVAIAPLRFARQLRVDESLRPPLAFMFAFVLYVAQRMTGGSGEDLPLAFGAVTLAILATTIPATIVLAILSSTGVSSAWGLRSRLSVYFALFCYTSWFLLLCMAFSPAVTRYWNDLSFFWPTLSPYHRTDDWIRTGFVTWWVVIVLCFVVVRSRPRKLAILLFPAVVVLIRMAFLIYEACFPRLSK